MVIGFGDFLIHLSPMQNERFAQSDLMQMTFTGAEANVCAALGFWGEDTAFVTKVPKHALAQKGISFLRGNGVRTQHIEYGHGRLGVYFLERGYSLRPSSVIYDRDGSVFVKSEYEDYNWDSILNTAKALYLSGITPSLSKNLFECCKKILAECKKRSILVYYDVNLRPNLCSIEESRQIFSALYPYIDYLIGNEEHLKQLLEIDMPEAKDVNRLYDLTKIIQAQTNINNIAITVRRTHSANHYAVYASFFSNETFAVSTKWDIDAIDRVGSGDAFSAGMLYAGIHGFSVEKTVEFSVASNALKHTINNDINFSTVDEIENLIHRKRCDVKR